MVCALPVAKRNALIDYCSDNRDAEQAGALERAWADQGFAGFNIDPKYEEPRTQQQKDDGVLPAQWTYSKVLNRATRGDLLKIVKRVIARKRSLA